MESLILPESARIVSTIFFALAIAHTFSVKYFAQAAERMPSGSVRENVLHLLGEVEVVFGLWAGVLVFYLTMSLSGKTAIEYLESRSYTEPIFVFVIMSVAATKPVLDAAERLMSALGAGLWRTCEVLRIRWVSLEVAEFLVILIVGPLIGSFITEPAAMTVCALLVLRKFFSRGLSLKFKYATLGLLFVNISIGGTLTSFAAPPVLMVASSWGWDSAFMMQAFGWKAAVAIVISTVIVALRFRKELDGLGRQSALMSGLQGGDVGTSLAAPWWLVLIHVVFLAFIVFTAHHVVIFVGAFMFFLGVSAVTKEYQEPLRLKEALLVAFFLGGLVVLGGPQGWWLEPVLSKLSDFSLFASATSLKAITDNAALTYLVSLVPDLSEASKYALMAGAVTGGGLTVIANAPNPAGYGILNASFGEGGINPFGLFTAAVGPTLIAALCFWFL